MNTFIYVSFKIILYWRDNMRKKDDQLQSILLDHARTLADIDGIDAVNIRAIAQRAGVATGTVYNYFANKNDILLALTEEYWKKTLAGMQIAIDARSFYEQLEQIFNYLREHIDHSAGRLMHSLENVEEAGHKRMEKMQSALEASLIRRMDQDPDIRQDIWNEAFTKEQYVRFITKNLTMLLSEKEPDLNFFISIIKKTIYY